MNSQEAVLLCRYARACCPAQKFDSHTPDAWFDLLGDIELGPAKDAVRRLAQTQVFVAPAEIRSLVNRDQMDRVNRMSGVIPPHELADEPNREQKWLRVMGDAMEIGHGEQQSRDIANHQFGITEDEPREIGAGGDPMKKIIARLAESKSLKAQDQAEFTERRKRQSESRAKRRTEIEDAEVAR